MVRQGRAGWRQGGGNEFLPVVRRKRHKKGKVETCRFTDGIVQTDGVFK